MASETVAVRRDGVVARLAEIGIGVLAAGAFLTWYAHYYVPFANPSGPVRWQNLAIVPTLLWRDLAVIANALAKPALLALAALPLLFLAALFVTARSALPRWARTLVHFLASLVFVVATIFVAGALRVTFN